MRKRLKQGILVFVVVFAAAQLVRPDRTNPPTDPGRAIQAHTAVGSGVAAVVDRACRDCHSNATVWPWYTTVAPVSWLMSYGVKKGRQAINFSEWGAYPADIQKLLLIASCEDVTAGRMPGPYTLLHPEMRLSAGDIEAICTASRQANDKGAL